MSAQIIISNQSIVTEKLSLVAIAVISVQLTTSGLEAQSQGLIRGNVANTDGKPIGGGYDHAFLPYPP